MHRLVVSLLLSILPTPSPTPPPASLLEPPDPPSNHQQQPTPSFEQRFTTELEHRRNIDPNDPANDRASTRESLRAALIDPRPLTDPVLDLVEAAIAAHAVALDGMAAELGADDVDAVPTLRRLDPTRGGTGEVRVAGLGPLNELVAHHRAWLETPDGRHPATVVVFSLSGESTPAVGRLVMPITRWVEHTTTAGRPGEDRRRVLYPEHWHARSELFWLRDGAWTRDEPVWLAAREVDPPRRPAFGRGVLACGVDCSVSAGDLDVPSLTTETGLSALPFRPTVEGIPIGARERARRGPRRQP